MSTAHFRLSRRVDLRLCGRVEWQFWEFGVSVGWEIRRSGGREISFGVSVGPARGYLDLVRRQYETES